MTHVEPFPDRRDAPAEDICRQVDSARAVGVGRWKGDLTDLTEARTGKYVLRSVKSFSYYSLRRFPAASRLDDENAR